MTDKDKVIITVVTIIVTSVISYRVNLVDKVLFKHTEQIEELKESHKPKENN